MLKTKLYKLANTIISVGVALLALAYLINMFIDKIDVVEFNDRFIKILGDRILLMVIFLFFFNWGAELLKWKILSQKIQRLSNRQLVESILLGITLGMLTPKRIGVVGGRLMHIEKGNRLRGFYLYSVSALTQLLTTILIGLIGLSFLIDKIVPQYSMDTTLKWGLAFSISSTLIVIYLFSGFFRRIVLFFSDKLGSGTVDRLVVNDRLKILLLSIGRYLAFSLQFGLLISVLDANFSWTTALMGISVVFIITSVIPTGWVAELPVRTSIAFFVFSQIGYDGVNALICSIMLWLINLFLPAIIGLLAIRKINWLELKSGIV